MWRNLRPFHSILWKLYVTQSSKISSSVTYNEIRQNFSNSVSMVYKKSQYLFGKGWLYSKYRYLKLDIFRIFFFQLLVRSFEGMDDLPTLLKILIKFLLTNLAIYFTVAKLSKTKIFLQLHHQFMTHCEIFVTRQKNHHALKEEPTVIPNLPNYLNVATVKNSARDINLLSQCTFY